MVLFIVAAIVGLHVAAVAWALRSPGRRRLWAITVAWLPLLAVGAAGVGIWYAVPSVPRLVLYVLTFCGPIVIVPALLLSWSGTRRASVSTNLAVALIGALVGLACGFVLAIYGLRGW